jgi:hypothetical protein
MTISTSYAATSDSYLTTGRAQLFNGTLSGVRSAYQTFDTGIKNSACADCASSRELRFFRAVAGMGMLFARDDGGSIDSGIELLKAFDIETLGQYWASYYALGANVLTFSPARDQRGTYKIPADAPTWAQIGTSLDSSILPKIDSIIADLNAVTDTPTVFKVMLTPAEIRIFLRSNYDILNPSSPNYDPTSRFLSPLEVDMGEVYLLRAAMYFIKSQLNARNAYDMVIADMDLLVKKGYGDWFGISKDLLSPYPDFLKVAPTEKNVANGKKILNDAKKNLRNAISACINGITYIQNENVPAGTDPQDNELLYIDPSDATISTNIKNRLATLSNSLAGDTVGTYPIQTIKTYNLSVSNSDTWQLKLNYNLIGEFDDNDYGTFISTNSAAPRYWTIDYVELSGNTLMIDMDCAIPGISASGYFTATLSSNGQTISDGRVDYWGDKNGSITNLSGSLKTTTVNNQKLDLNPIYGSTTRYPNPVALRNILPQFDELNAPLPGTVGSGLSKDATLGGILPGRTQNEWQKWFDLQPTGTKNIKSTAALPIVIDGNITEWNTAYRLFTDPQGDLEIEPPLASITGVDVSEVYLSSDPTYLYGAIKFYDNISNSNYYYYCIILSYAPSNDSSLHTMGIVLNVSKGTVSSGLQFMDDTKGWLEWEFPETDIQCVKGTNGIEFRVPLSQLPGALDGRYVIVDSEGWTEGWTIGGGESNWTHIKIGQTGTLSGTVAFDGPANQAISVQAFTDLDDPDDSVVARTVINKAGSYSLTGIGRGWSGYVRASTPLFGFQNYFFDDGGFNIISDAVAVTLPAGSSTVAGKNLALTMPVTLYNGVSVVGYFDTDLEETDHFVFHAVKGGTYTIELTGDIIYSGLWISLLDRNAGDELSPEYNWGDPIRLEWTCQTSGAYYIELDSWGTGGSYQLRMTAIVPLIHGSVKPDFNGDNKTDLLWRDTKTGKYSGTIMNGLTKVQTVSLGGGSSTLETAGLTDFDGDGKTDLIWRNTNTGVYSGTIMNDLTKVQTMDISGSFTSMEMLGLADFNGDGRIDILWRDVSTGAYQGVLMNGLVKLQTAGLGGSFTTLEIVDLGDFNADGKTDLLWRDVNSGKYYGTIMNGLTKVETKGLGGSFTTLEIVDLGDFNADGKTDILWRNVSTGVYQGTIMNGLTKVQTTSLGGSSSIIQIDRMADFNGDGKTDLLWRDVNTCKYYGTIMDSLQKVQTLGLGGSSTLPIVGLADFNGDGKTDILWRNISTGAYSGTIMDGLTKGQTKSLGGSTTLEIP